MRTYRIRFHSQEKDVANLLNDTMQRVGGHVAYSQVEGGPSWYDHVVIVRTDLDGYHLNEAIANDVRQGKHPGLLSNITITDYLVYDGFVKL